MNPYAMPLQPPAFAENPSCSTQPEGGSAGRTYLMAMALMVRKWGETTVYLHHLLIMAATGNSEAYVKHVNWRSSGRRRLLHSTLCLCDGGVRKKFNSIALNDYSHMSFFFRFPPSLFLYFSFMNVAIGLRRS